MLGSIWLSWEQKSWFTQNSVYSVIINWLADHGLSPCWLWKHRSFGSSTMCHFNFFCGKCQWYYWYRQYKTCILTFCCKCNQGKSVLILSDKYSWIWLRDIINHKKSLWLNKQVWGAYWNRVVLLYPNSLAIKNMVQKGNKKINRLSLLINILAFSTIFSFNKC